MSFYDEFEAEVKKYFGIPQEAKINILDDATYQEGCPTCGGSYEFRVEVYYYDDSKKTKTNRYGYVRHVYTGKMSEFLREL